MTWESSLKLIFIHQHLIELFIDCYEKLSLSNLSMCYNLNLFYPIPSSNALNTQISLLYAILLLRVLVFISPAVTCLLKMVIYIRISSLKNFMIIAFSYCLYPDPSLMISSSASYEVFIFNLFLFPFYLIFLNTDQGILHNGVVLDFLGLSFNLENLIDRY